MTGDSISIVVMVLAIILVIPLLCRKMHIPSIVGFIAMGIVIGPSVLNLIPAGSTTLTTLGQLGMLYIMFQAGIEIDRNDFLQQRRRAVYFGLLTFLVPFCLGLMTGWAMGFDRLTMILLAAIYGSHTLMTYPIVTRYGIQKSPAVTIAVGGTSIAMVLSLGVLVVVKNNYLDVAAPWWFFTIRIVGFLIAVAWLLPKMLHWVFKRWQDPLLEFMIVMLALVVSSWLADLVDLEPILGAFLCGAALNGLVPKRSQLMDEINFLGNGIFVPMFLLSVGMMMDLSSFKSGGLVFAIAGLMIGTKLVGKWLASWIAQRGFRMSGDERRLLFGLTHASAAGTLAIATIGHQIGLFDSYILNAAVILILVLSILASFVTEYAAKPIALKEKAKMVAEKDREQWLLLSVGENADMVLRRLGVLADLNGVEIRRSMNWQDATKILEHDSRGALIYKERQPLNTIQRIIVAVPRWAEKEHDFISCFGLIRRLSGQIGARVMFYATKETQHIIQAFCRRKGKYLPARYKELTNWEDIVKMKADLEENDLLVIISARQSTASYDPNFTQIPNLLTKEFNHYSHLVLYPEQGIDGTMPDWILSERPQPSRTWHILSIMKKRILLLTHRKK